MPTLRLDEVLAEHTIPPEIAVHVDRLRSKGTTLDKLDDETASDLRAIAEAVKISVFDLFVPSEQMYRLRISELVKTKYTDKLNLKEQLEALLLDLSKANKISFALLGIYSTQILPETLLKGSDIKEICTLLKVTLEELKELSDAPSQTISVESLLKKLDITLDELAILLEIPKEFIPWISKDNIKEVVNTNPSDESPSMRTNDSTSLPRSIRGGSRSFHIRQGSNPFCNLVCSVDNLLCSVVCSN